MTTYSNEAVLEALRRAQYRQVPWARRPGVFQYLRALGLMDTVRQRTVAPAPGFHAPVDIAVLTEHDERLLSWTAQRMNDYVVAPFEARSTAALEVRS
jgi:hypothetical protein